MKSNYLCPICRSHLQVDDDIIFSARTTDGKKKGLMVLNPGLGNYTVKTNKHSLHLEHGDHLTLYCPVCFQSLSAHEVNQNLAKLIMIDDNGKEYDIYFSEIVGERCTYKVSQDTYEHFGEDHEHYNPFGQMSSYYY